MARGLGTRMRAEAPGSALSSAQEKVAAAGIKALMPLGNGLTLLEMITAKLGDAGFDNICLVIGPEHDAIREFCSDKKLNVQFAVQPEPRGTADAVLAAENFVDDSDLFAVVNSDNLYPVDALRLLRGVNAPSLLAFERNALIEKSNIPADRITKFATAEIGDDGRLLRIVEKPDDVPADSLVSMNAWLFPPEIFEACRSIGTSERGEYELAAAVQFAVDELGIQFRALTVAAGVLDLSNRADVQSIEKFLVDH